MIPFDWGLQYDPRGYLFISEMVSGVYVVQMDEDKNPDWGLQYDPRGYLFISEMVSGVYVVQMDEDKNPDFVYPPLYMATEDGSDE